MVHQHLFARTGAAVGVAEERKEIIRFSSCRQSRFTLELSPSPEKLDRMGCTGNSSDTPPGLLKGSRAPRMRRPISCIPSPVLARSVSLERSSPCLLS